MPVRDTIVPRVVIENVFPHRGEILFTTFFSSAFPSFIRPLKSYVKKDPIWLTQNGSPMQSLHREQNYRNAFIPARDHGTFEEDTN